MLRLHINPLPRRHRADRHPHACPMPPLRGSCLFSCLYPMAHAMGYPMPPLPRLRHRTDARARREAGDWRLEAGDWRLETGGWRGAGFLDGLRDRRRHREWFAPTRHACAGVSHGVATLGSPRRQPWGRRGSAEKPRQGRHRSAVPTVIAVGTVLADRPPHRSVRAGLPHTALTLSFDAQTTRDCTYPFQSVQHFHRQLCAGHGRW